MKIFDKLKSKKGFTVIEVVVAIAILAIISGVSVAFVFNMQKSMDTGNTLSIRQYNSAFAQEIIDSYVKTGEVIFIDDKSSPDYNPTSENDVVIEVGNGNEGKPAIFIKQAKSNHAGGFDYETIHQLENGKSDNTAEGTQIDKIKFQLIENNLGSNKTYKLFYTIYCGTYELQCGVSALNMKTLSGGRLGDFELDISNEFAPTTNRALKIVLLDDPAIIP